MILDAVADWQENAPRTRQSTARVLGMSELGGCREYIRASIAGEPKGKSGLKWAAYVGTAVGDFTEGIMEGYGAKTQEDVVLTLPLTGIKVSGHTDIRLPNRVVDLKTKDKLDDVRREGPPFKNKVQIAGYLLANLESGLVDEDATGHLVYLDRSGVQAEAYVWSTTVDQARLILETAEERLLDVQHALATATRNGRDGHLMTDEPESWCFHVQCPFYQACWAGHRPTGTVEHPRELDAVRRMLEAKADEKNALSRRAQAKEDLRGVEGVTPDGTMVKWTITTNPSGGFTEKLEVRAPKS